MLTTNIPSTLLILLLSSIAAAIPAPPHYYSDQLVDHDGGEDGAKWDQRHYIWDKEFLGPGHPIFIIFGGEDTIDPEVGLYYPFITHHLAKDFGAFVLEPEHRFYGESHPVVITPDNDPRMQLLTPEQAIQDFLRLTKHYQSILGCSPDKTSPDYCPVVSVGGSYPGWLSAMARLLYPDVIDIGYAASAPTAYYAQLVDSDAYYEHVSMVADKCLPGCSANVESALAAVDEMLQRSSVSEMDSMMESLGFCANSLPDYIQDMDTLADEVFMIIAYRFAMFNMQFYPPTEWKFRQACRIFSSPKLDPLQKVEFFVKRMVLPEDSKEKDECVDMKTQVPTGPNATISGGDWTGDGVGSDAETYDFQTCTLTVVQIGFSEASMFPERDWTMEWMTDHCMSRFGVPSQPLKLVNEWHFDDLAGSTDASHIIFTNGLNDPWSQGSIMENLSDNLLALNFENGAHHSDLTKVGPSDIDTPDIVEGHNTIRTILTDWLNEIQPEKYPVNGSSQRTAHHRTYESTRSQH